MSKRLQIRRDTEANWQSVNPVLLQGEIGFVLDDNGNVVGKKVGNGRTAWDELEFHQFGSGGGVTIVESVDALDPDAPQGALATVAINTFREIKWSEVYQPTEEELSQPFEEIVGKLTRISKIEVTPPESMDIMPNEQDEYKIIMRSSEDQGVIDIQKTSVIYHDDSLVEFIMSAYTEDDVNYTWEVNDNRAESVNKRLSDSPTYYVQSTLNYWPTPPPSFLDDIIHIYTGEVSTELYIKTDKGWTPYKESDTVYIDSNAMSVYNTVEFEDGCSYFEIPINEFSNVTRGVEIDNLGDFRFITLDGTTRDPLMSEENHFYTPTYIYKQGALYYGLMFDIRIDIDTNNVYVGNWVEKKLEAFNSYNSEEELPTEDEVGSIAEIIKNTSIFTSLYSLKYPQHSTDQNNGAVSSIHPVKLLPIERIAQQTNTQIKFMSRSGSNGSYSTFTIEILSSELVWTLQQGSTTKSGKLVYWEDDKYVVNSADFDFINTELGSYSYKVSSPIAPREDSFVDIDKFLEVPAVVKCVFLYVKNETGWEEYDKATKDKVTTLETKVAELEAKIQELLQN